MKYILPIVSVVILATAWFSINSSGSVSTLGQGVVLQLSALILLALNTLLLFVVKNLKTLLGIVLTVVILIINLYWLLNIFTIGF